MATNEQLKNNEALARQVAIENLRVSEGIESLIDNWEDYNDAIRGGDKEVGDTLTAEEAKLYNATLSGALKANTVLLESEVNAYNTAIRNRAIIGVKKQMGDMLTARNFIRYTICYRWQNLIDF